MAKKNRVNYFIKPLFRDLPLNHSFLRSIVRSFVHFFIRLFNPSFVCSFLHSCIRSLIHPFNNNKSKIDIFYIIYNEKNFIAITITLKYRVNSLEEDQELCFHLSYFFKLIHKFSYSFCKTLVILTL